MTPCVLRQTPVGALFAFVVAAAAMTVPPVVAAQSASELPAEDSSEVDANFTPTRKAHR